jgi:hypothetical protein
MPNKKTKVEGVEIHEKTVLTSELAAVVGKTPQWIRQLTKEGVLQQVDRGKYVLGEAVQAYIEYASGGKEDTGKPRYIDEKTEHERLKKERAALELERLRGELHSAKDVELLVSDLILTTKAKLQVIPSKLAPRLEHESAAVIEREIRKEINAVLTALSNYDPAEAGK